MPFEPKFPTVIDNSIIESFRSCPRKFFYSHVLGLSSPGKSVHLVFGGAFAKGLEVARIAYYRDKMPADDAKLLGQREILRYWEKNPIIGEIKGNKTVERCALLLEEYLEHYPFSSDPIQPYHDKRTGPSIEFTFALPLPITHPETGEPLLYGGRFDMLGVVKEHDLLAVVDEKTTSQIPAFWARQWVMRGQFIGYVYAARQFGYNVNVAVVRGLNILKYETRFVETLVDIPSWQIDRWYDMMLNTVLDMVGQYQPYIAAFDKSEIQQLAFPLNYGSACTNYGMCQFFDLCTARNPKAYFGDFEERRWNPLDIEGD